MEILMPVSFPKLISVLSGGLVALAMGPPPVYVMSKLGCLLESPTANQSLRLSLVPYSADTFSRMGAFSVWMA